MNLFHKPKNVKTRWASFENPTAAKGAAATENKGAKGHPSDSLAPGETKTLLDVTGSGTVCRIWITINSRSSRRMVRGLRLRMYWDGSRGPAVDCPLGDFCAPDMACWLWGGSPLWAIMCGTTSWRQLRCREAPWEGSPRQDIGLDEQKSDTRLASQGKGAMDSDAQNTFGCGDSKSGEGQWTPTRLTPGGLSNRSAALVTKSPRVARVTGRQGHHAKSAGTIRQKSAEAIVVATL